MGFEEIKEIINNKIAEIALGIENDGLVNELASALSHKIPKNGLSECIHSFVQTAGTNTSANGDYICSKCGKVEKQMQFKSAISTTLKPSLSKKEIKAIKNNLRKITPEAEKIVNDFQMKPSWNSEELDKVLPKETSIEEVIPQPCPYSQIIKCCTMQDYARNVAIRDCKQALLGRKD
ncbi:MAG: hypothetical protein WC979_09770 [Candidatus Pacearchaeota archaeon]|jgi:hypothetical protein